MSKACIFVEEQHRNSLWKFQSEGLEQDLSLFTSLFNGIIYLRNYIYNVISLIQRMLCHQ